MTLSRTPEPELMDSEVQVAAYAAADFADSNRLFCDLFFDRLGPLTGRGQLVDLGCGPADITLRLARRLPDWRLTAVDAGANMLKTAARAVSEAGLDDRVSLQLARLPDPALGEGRFDAVVSNSVLHHLPDPAILWRSVRQLAAPGAGVLIMDLARPGSAAAVDRLVDEYAGDEPGVLRDDFRQSLHAAYTLAEVREQLQAADLEQLTVDTVSDRHWCVSGRLPSA